MKRGLFVCVATLALLVRPASLFAQSSQWINELIGAMVTSGFDFNEVDKLRMAKLLSEKGIVNCQVVEWGKSVDTTELSNDERVAFLEERVEEFDTKVKFVAQKLNGMVGSSEQSLNLARSISRDNDLQTILDEVMPSVQTMVDKVKDDLQNQIDITRIVSGEYRLKFESLCQRVKSIDQRLSALEQQGVPGQRQTRKPISDNAPNNFQAPPTSDNQGVLYPDRIVSDKSVLCASSMLIQKCYDYMPLEDLNGRIVRRAYHGDLYSDCNGYILVTHVKTSGTSSPTTYQPAPYQGPVPTLAPRLP